MKSKLADWPGGTLLFRATTFLLVIFMAIMVSISIPNTVYADTPNYTVTYAYNGATGGAVPAGPTQYVADATVTVSGNSGNLVKTGYAFGGWMAGSIIYQPGQTLVIGNNVTLTAVWVPVYNVTYDGNGNDSGTVPVDSGSYIGGALVTVLGNTGNLSSSTEGSFYGWNTKADGSGTKYVPGDILRMGAADVILYAQYSEVIPIPTHDYYTVTYNGNGNTGGYAPSDSTHYPTIPVVVIGGPGNLTISGNIGGLVKTGQYFTGWNTRPDGTGTTYQPGANFNLYQDLTLYALWLPGYTITYSYNSSAISSSPPNDPYKYRPGTSAKVLANSGTLNYEGGYYYTFGGWNTQPDGSGTTYQPDDFFTVNSNVKLYALWKDKRQLSTQPYYYVHYRGNGNTGGSVPSDPGHTQYGMVTTLGNTGNLVRDGYTFGGWRYSNTNLYKAGDTWQIPPYDITLYAVWIPNYTLSYDGNGADGGTAPAGSTLFLPGTAEVSGNTGNFTKSYKYFIGWNTQTDGTGTSYQAGDTIILTGNVTLYAQYLPVGETPPPSVVVIKQDSINYWSNGADGGTLPVDNQRYQAGDIATLPGNTGNLSRQGYYFAGWSLTPQGSPVTYFIYPSGTSIVNVYAVWTWDGWPGHYRVTYNGNGNTGGLPPNDYNFYPAGDTVPLPGNTGNLVMDGNLFVGWTCNNQIYLPGDTVTMPSSNLTIKAVWGSTDLLQTVHRVIYDGNGNNGGSVPADAVGYQTGGVVHLPGNTGNLHKAGFVFGGWNDRMTTYQPEDTLTMGPNDITLYAVWIPAQTVSYDGNGNTGGSVPIDVNGYLPNTTVTVAGNTSNLEKTNSVFDGWWFNNTLYQPGSTFSMGTANVTLSAVWVPSPVPVPVPVPVITSLSPSHGPTSGGTAVTLTGTGFTGATSVNFGNTAGTDLTITSDTSLTVTAPAGIGMVDVTVSGPDGTSATGVKYTYDMEDVSVTTYTVIFQDWNGTVLKSDMVNNGAAATAPNNPNRTGYIFTGWDSDFSNITSDLTVTAHYSQNPLSLTMSPVNGIAGDTIGFSGKTMASTAITVKVVQADGTEVYSQSLTSDASGNFSGSFNVPDSMASGILFGSAEAAGRKVTSNVVIHEAEYVPPVVIDTSTVTVSNDGSNKNLELPATVSTTTTPITVSIPATVNDATISVFQMMNTPVDGVVTTQPLPAMDIEAVTAISSSPVKVEIPAETTISAPASSNWNGIINVPTVKANNTVSVGADTGKTATVNTVIEVGYGDVPLAFNKAVRLLIPGMAGKDAGYIRNGNFTKITQLLSADSQSVADVEIPDEGDARIDVGSDMVIWTKHFTSFIAYTQTSSSQSGDTSSNNGGNTSNPQTLTQIVADSNGNVRVTVSPTLNQDTGAASVQVDTATMTEAFAKAAAAADGVKTVVIELPQIAGAEAYETTLPASFLVAGDATNKVELKNNIASLTVPGNMLTSACAAGAQNVSLTIASADKSKLDTVVQAQIGDRPVIEINLKMDGQKIAWSNAGAPVTVTIPYTPTAGELLNPESIVIWYIDGSGKLVTVPNSHYDPATGMVIFSTTHFSYYAVAYEPVRRLAGTDRIDTALTIAKATYPDKISNVILATAGNYPDALAGSVLAQKLNAPILLVGSTDKDQAKVLNYLKENMDTSGQVYILGGTGAVRAVMEEKVQASGYQNIKRIGGYDAYETAAKITDALQVETGTPVVLVSGRSYADALSISSMAAFKQYPILLVNQDGIPETVKNELQKIKPEKVYIIGLQGALSPEIEKQVLSLTNMEQTDIIRIGGIDRYVTSREVGRYFYPETNILCMATGNNFPDALTGSIYAAIHQAPIMLVNKTLSTEEIKYLQDMKAIGVTIFGGTAVVSQALENQLSQLFGQ